MVDIESREAMHALGARLAHWLEPGMLICINGELGAGKTELSRGIASALGIPAGDIVSPTYPLVQVYNGKVELWHCDLYRIDDISRVDELGLFEALSEGAVLLVEWSMKFQSQFEQVDRLEVRISLADELSRSIELSASGTRYTELLHKLSL